MKYAILTILCALTMCSNPSSTNPTTTEDPLIGLWKVSIGDEEIRSDIVIHLKANKTFEDTLTEYINGMVDEVEYGYGTYTTRKNDNGSNSLIFNRIENEEEEQIINTYNVSGSTLTLIDASGFVVFLNK